MVRETTADDIRYVCAHMRAVDAEEQFATRFPGDDTPEALARDMMARMPQAIGSFAFCIENEPAPPEPVCILSAYLVSPGVAKLHRISTDQWNAVRGEVFRFGLEKFMPMLQAGVHRAECLIRADCNEAARILIHLGFYGEGLARRRGRAQEDFITFAWVRPPDV